MLELIIFQVGIFKLTLLASFLRLESTKYRARQPMMGSLTHGAHAVILGLTARGLQRKQVYKQEFTRLEELVHVLITKHNTVWT